MSQRDLTPFGGLLAWPDRPALEKLLELLMEENFAERGCLWLEETHDLIYRGDESLRIEFPFSRRVVDSVLDKGRGFVSYDTRHDERLGPTGSIAMNNVRSCLCSAARDPEGGLVAIAYFDNCSSLGNFTREDLEFLDQVMALFPSSVLLQK